MSMLLSRRRLAQSQQRPPDGWGVVPVVETVVNEIPEILTEGDEMGDDEEEGVDARGMDYFELRRYAKSFGIDTRKFKKHDDLLEAVLAAEESQ